MIFNACDYVNTWLAFLIFCQPPKSQIIEQRLLPYVCELNSFNSISGQQQVWLSSSFVADIHNQTEILNYFAVLTYIRIVGKIHRKLIILIIS